MIERLIDETRPCGDPAYRETSEQITKLLGQLNARLSADGQNELEQLAGLYMRLEAAVLRDAFAEGFRSAAELTAEVLRRT